MKFPTDPLLRCYIILNGGKAVGAQAAAARNLGVSRTRTTEWKERLPASRAVELRDKTVLAAAAHGIDLKQVPSVEDLLRRS